MREDEKKEVSEMLMFSGLESQSEINRLLEELYSSPLSRTSLGEGRGCRALRRGGAEHLEGVQEQARGEEHRPLRAEIFGAEKEAMMSIGGYI